jgi:hypothetical protein
MIEKLLDIIKDHANSIGLNINIYYSSITDTAIEIGFKTTRPQNIEKYGNPFITIQDADRDRAFAKAYIELTEWLSENFGGY